MARIETDPNFTGPTFSRATAGTDLFKKEDVQQLAAAVSTHVHDGVHGLSVAPAAATIPGTALTNGSVTLAKLAADSVDSSKIVDGTIATADLANSSVTNAKLAADTARLNLLTNGGFEVWQRGNGPFTANSAYTADRWLIALGTSDTLSVSRDSTNYDTGSQYCAAAVYTRSGGNSLLSQDSKLTDSLALRGRAMTFSARVRTSTANAVRLFIGDGVGNTANSTYHSGSGTYETLSVTVTAGVTSPNVQVRFVFDQSCTAYLDNAMLVVGSVAADYAPLHPADDLARCLRYYEIVGESSGEFLLNLYGSAGGAVQTYVPYKVRKAVVPTATKNGTWLLGNSSQPSSVGAGLGGFSVQTTATAAGLATLSNNAANCNFTFEGNP